MFEAAEPEQQEFVAGEVGCVLHIAPATAMSRVGTAVAICAQPRLLAGLDHGQLSVGQARALLDEIGHLDAAHATAVLDAVLGDNPEAELDATPGELRSTVKRAIIAHDPKLAKKRHEAARRTAGVHGRPLPDGMGQVVIDCTAVQMATALAAIDGRAAAMSFAPDPETGEELTVGQRRVAAFLHALGCDRTHIQAVLECPVERAVDVHATAHAPVWTVGVQMPVAVALGLSDHPAILTGYGPIDADQARTLLPTADLLKACVDASTGQVLTADRPLRAKSWQATDPDQARALRQTLIAMATSGGTRTDLTTDGYVPSQALGHLVDLRDVTSTFPGDSTPARACDRDHRLPYPLGETNEQNLQNARRRWHRAKHTGWHTSLLADGTLRWTSPSHGVYDRKPKRTPPPTIPSGTTLPPINDTG
jgi:hypothetical protein